MVTGFLSLSGSYLPGNRSLFGDGVIFWWTHCSQDRTGCLDRFRQNKWYRLDGGCQLPATYTQLIHQRVNLSYSNPAPFVKIGSECAYQLLLQKDDKLYYPTKWTPLQCVSSNFRQVSSFSQNKSFVRYNLSSSYKAFSYGSCLFQTQFHQCWL